MIYRILLIVVASVLFGYAAGSMTLRSGSMFGVGGQAGAAAGALLSSMAAICLRRKPLGTALVWWIGPTSLVIAVLAPLAAPWLTLTLGSLFAFVACAVIFVQMDDFDVERPNHCEQCGYDLLGSEADACPECGHLRPERAPASGPGAIDANPPDTPSAARPQ